LASDDKRDEEFPDAVTFEVDVDAHAGASVPEVVVIGLLRVRYRPAGRSVGLFSAGE
jgi:hypothetical protein